MMNLMHRLLGLEFAATLRAFKGVMFHFVVVKGYVRTYSELIRYQGI